MVPLFPEGSLVSSVVTTTWVGVAVVCFFNLRFGWALSGIVVPGYLVPLFLLRPSFAAAVLIDAVLTYALVWTWSEVLSRRLGGSSLFGRDRFFALVLVSTAVRVVSDLWMLPVLQRLAFEQFGPSLLADARLQSFGLVIVPLVANQLWNSGLRRGTFHLAITAGLTLVIVRYGLMELTNFRIASLAYLYEDFAAALPDAPKAYLILLTTALVASRLNLFYGWDFSGILLPALIGLQWFQPTKVFISLAEAVVILAICSALLRTRLFANASIEGARKLLVFFNVGFAWKMLLGLLLPQVAPNAKVSDFFGFGYLLSTLLAVKMHDRGFPLRLVCTSIQASAAGLAIATVIGFTLQTWLGAPAVADVSAHAGPPTASSSRDESPRDAARLPSASPPARTEPAESGSPVQVSTSPPDAWLARAPPADHGRDLRPPRLEELLLLDRQVLTPVIRAAQDGEASRGAHAASIEAANGSAQALGYHIVRLRPDAGGEFLVLEPDPAGEQDWGRMVLRLGPARPFVMEVPHPWEVATGECAGAFFDVLRARALLLTSASPGAPDLLAAPNAASFFTLAGQVLMRESHGSPMMLVQVRARSPGDVGAPAPDAMVAYGTGARQREDLDDLEMQLLGAVQAATRSSVTIATGGAESAGYGPGLPPQTWYFALAPRKSGAVVWISPQLRAEIAARDEDGIESAQFAALEVPTREMQLERYVKATPQATRRPSARLQHLLAAYVEERDIVVLRDLRTTALREGWSLERVVEGLDRYLSFVDPGGSVGAVANLWPDRSREGTATSAPAGAQAERSRSGARSLVLEGGWPPRGVR